VIIVDVIIIKITIIILMIIIIIIYILSNTKHYIFIEVYTATCTYQCSLLKLEAILLVAVIILLSSLRSLKNEQRTIVDTSSTMGFERSVSS